MKAKYERLVEQLPGIIYLYNRDSGATFWSDRITEVLGISIDQLKTNPKLWNESIHPDDQNNVATLLANLKAEDQFEIEYRVIDQGGNMHWFSDRGNCFTDENDQLIIEGIANDITKKKQAEIELSQSEERFRALFEQSLSPKIIIDPNGGRILDANASAIEFYGYTHDQLLSMKIYDINMLTAEEINLKMQQASSGNNVLFHFRHRLATGSIRNVLVDSSPIRYDDSMVLLSTIFDITDMVVAEAEREEALKDLKLAQNIASIGNWKLDPVTGISEWSDEVYRIYERDPSLGPIPFKEYSVLYEDDQFEKINRAITGAMNDGISYDLDLRLKLSGDRVKYLRVMCQPEKLENGKGYLLRGTIQDITENILIQEKLKERESKLRELNETKDILLSIIGHDLKSPFNSLIGLSDILINRHREMDEAKRDQMLRLLRYGAGNAYNLVENLLTWASIQRNRITLTPEKIHLQELVRKIINIFSTEASKKTLTLHNHVDKELVCKTDSNMLELVLRNLVNNAVKYNKPGGEIIVDATTSNTTDKGSLEISVTDSGVGIPPDKLKDLFSLSSNKSTLGTAEEKGSGLGLMLCNEIISMLSGELKVESTEGKGSRFYFILPCI